MLGEHRKSLEKRQKDKDLTQAQIEKYKDTFPSVCNKSVNVRSIVVVVGVLATLSYLKHTQT